MLEESSCLTIITVLQLLAENQVVFSAREEVWATHEAATSEETRVGKIETETDGERKRRLIRMMC